MPAPLLTIAVPFHSGVDYLKRALDSVVVQGVEPTRVIVVDDAGPDGDAAAALVAGYGERFTYERNPANLGLAGNWNRCLGLAATDLVTLLHADDELLPGYVAAVMAGHQRHPDVAAVFANATVIGARGEPKLSVPDLTKRLIARRQDDDLVVTGDDGLAHLMQGQFIFCPSLCYRRSVVGDAPFDSHWRQVLDLALLADLLFAGRTLVGVPETAYAYRRHGESQTAVLTGDATRFAEEIAVYESVAARAAAAGWVRTAQIAGRRRVVRAHLTYRIGGDLLGRRWAAARAKSALLRSAGGRTGGS